jgi:type IV pilus assembly protein PilV
MKNMNTTELPVTQRGIGLIEAMVTMFVLSIGLLGMAFAETWSLRYGQDAYMRTQAMFIAYELIDKIRIHNIPADNSGASLYTQTRSSGNVDACVSTVASVDNTRNCFYDALDDLPSGNADITTDGKNYNITIVWLDREAVNNPSIDTQSECEAADRVWSSTLTWPASGNPSPNPATCLQAKTWVARI